MNKINKIEILKKLLKSFDQEDKEEPFLNREYVEETKRIYDNLINGNCCESEEKAINDIVSDIFKYLSVDGWDN